MCTQQNIYDRRGLRIASSWDYKDRIELYDKHGLKLGIFHKNLNMTVNKHGSRVGTGNLLFTLIQ